MKLPPGEDLALAVTLLVTGEAVAIHPATFLRLEATWFAVHAGAARIPVGSRVVVVAGQTRLLGKVRAVEGPLVTVDRVATHDAERRAAPRVRPLARLRWRSEDAWHASAVTDLSMSGVSFVAEAAPPTIGARVALELVLAPETAPHAVDAIVRRSEATAAGARIGAEFLEMDEWTADALADLSLSCT
jgi:hypothetical protein